VSTPIVRSFLCRWSYNKAAEQLPQLILYSVIGANFCRELGLKRVLPRFVVLTKGKNPSIQVIEPHANQADVERLKESVLETADAISKGVFVKREGWQCSQCPYSGR